MRDKKRSVLLEKIGQRIENKRLELGIGKTEFAEKIEISRMQFDRIIKGETNSSILVLEKICEVTGMNLSELVSLN